MFCKYCGKDITDDSAYCRFCGKPQTDTTQSSPYSQNIYIHFGLSPEERNRRKAYLHTIRSTIQNFFIKQQKQRKAQKETSRNRIDIKQPKKQEHNTARDFFARNKAPIITFSIILMLVVMFVLYKILSQYYYFPWDFWW